MHCNITDGDQPLQSLVVCNGQGNYSQCPHHIPRFLQGNISCYSLRLANLNITYICHNIRHIDRSLRLKKIQHILCLLIDLTGSCCTISSSMQQIFQFCISYWQNRWNQCLDFYVRWHILVMSLMTYQSSLFHYIDANILALCSFNYKLRNFPFSLCLFCTWFFCSLSFLCYLTYFSKFVHNLFIFQCYIINVLKIRHLNYDRQIFS